MVSASDLLRQTGTVAAVRDALDALITVAYSCPITGLHNRRALDDLTKEAPAFQGDIYGAVMIDLTGFKRVNDEGSHAAGDAALRTVGQTILKMCADSFAHALAFRYGGDEFCILVPIKIFDEFTEPEHLTALSWPDFTLQRKSLPFGASIGIARPDDTIGLLELIARADGACRVSKHNRDRPTAWTPELETSSPIVSLRKRCPSCSATTVLEVAQREHRPDGFRVCPNCGGGL